MAHHIVIVGAGPRGTYCLRRVLLQLEREPLERPVHVHVIEKSGRFGGGGVHDTAQPGYLLLNTIGSQITAFGDDDTHARASVARKTLHGYLSAKGVDIGPNDYPSRAQHGEYLAAMFDWSVKHRPPGVTVHCHVDQAVDIQPLAGGRWNVVQENGPAVPADELLLLTGHAKNRVVPVPWRIGVLGLPSAQARRRRNVSYVHLVYPVVEKACHVQPGDGVYVIGSGLTAIDLVKSFTVGRGGRFDGGRYLPSGREPNVILGSRLGLPYAARSRNEKTGLYQGQIFTGEKVSDLKRRYGKLDLKDHLLPLIREEMALVYYTTLMGRDFGRRYLGCRTEAERAGLVREQVPRDRRFSWPELEDPFRALADQAPTGQPWFPSLDAYHRFVIAHLRRDIAEAEQGNLTSPIKTAVDAVLRDLRDTLRMAVDRGGLTARSHRYLYGPFNRINNRIAVGPPVSSTRELLILAEAGLVSFSGPDPRLDMDTEAGAFTVESDRVAGSLRCVQHVLNGRIHGVDTQNDTSPLMRNLLDRGMIRTYVNADETGVAELGGLDVSDDFHIIDRDGRPHPHICALGIPVEGKFWFTAADARPDVDSNAIGQLARWSAQAVSRLRIRENGIG